MKFICLLGMSKQMSKQMSNQMSKFIKEMLCRFQSRLETIYNVKIPDSCWMSRVPRLPRTRLPHTRLPRASNSSNPVVSGIAFENKIARIISELSYMGKPLSVSKTAKTGHLPDIRISVGEYTSIGIEVKRKNAFEGGGRSFKLSNGVLIMNDPFFNSLLPKDYVPFGGRIPKFKFGCSLEEWLEEKPLFRDERFEITNETVVSDYYLKQGSNYILIEGKGLYHTGIDVLDLNVPFFKCKCTIRIRCKQHHSTSLPSSIQASVNYKKGSLISSPYDLETCLPEKFSSTSRGTLLSLSL